MSFIKGALGGVKKGWSSATSTVKDAFSSHDAMTKTATAAQVATNPLKALTFASFITYIAPAIPDADETDPCTLSPEELKLVQVSVLLASLAYSDHDERVIPADIGTQVYKSESSAVGKIPFYIVDSDSMNKIFVCCRGSYCFNDFVTDIMANAVEVEGHLIHHGFYTAAHSVFIPIENYLQQLSEKYDHNREIIFTGHSLGAAVAGLVADMFVAKKTPMKIKAYIFAPPAAVSKDKWEISRAYTKSFILGEDCVPFFSLHNLAGISADVVPDYFEEVIVEAVSREHRQSVDVEVNMQADFNPFDAPPPSEEQALADDTLAKRTTALYPAGEHYHLQLGGGDMFKTVELRKIRSCDYFGHFIKGLTEQHHFISRYIESINYIAQQGGVEIIQP